MLFYIVIVMLGCLILLSFYGAKAYLEIELFENEHSQGIKLHIKLPFYKYSQSYDYSDPKLHLLEALLIDSLNSRTNKPSFNFVARKALIKKLPDLHNIIQCQRDFVRIFKKALAYTVVKELQWKTTIGGSDAMQTALQNGYFWALKGWVLAFISSHSQLENLELAVEPDFTKLIFLSKFTCILKIRIVHIITIVIYILVWKVRWWINGITAGTAEQPSH